MFKIDNNEILFALAAFYLWLLFGFLSSSVSCDMNRLLSNNILIRNIIGVMSFFLLFAVVDKDNNESLYNLAFKTMFVYAIFILMSKNKWYFSLPILFLIFIERAMQVYINNKSKINDNDNIDKPSLIIIDHDFINKINKIQEYLRVSIYGLILLGFLSYAYRQKKHFKHNFSLYKLIFNFKCRK